MSTVCRQFSSCVWGGANEAHTTCAPALSSRAPRFICRPALRRPGLQGERACCCACCAERAPPLHHVRVQRRGDRHARLVWGGGRLGTVIEAFPDMPAPGALQPHDCHGTSAWDRKLPKHRPSLPFPPTLPECDNPYDTRYKPERLLIYDKHPGGIGLCAAVSMRGCKVHEGSKFTCQERGRAG